MRLLGSLTSPFTRKVRIMLVEKRIDCELELVDVNAPDNPVLARNPLSKIPTLVLDDGTSLFDSRVIVEFLDNASPIARLIPADKRARVAVRRWEALADGVLDAGLLVRYESLRPKKEQSATWTERQLGKMRRGIEMLASDLGSRNWCYGERYSLADIALGCTLGWVAFRLPQMDWRTEHPDLARHFDRLMTRPAFAESVPREK